MPIAPDYIKNNYFESWFRQPNEEEFLLKSPTKTGSKRKDKDKTKQGSGSHEKKDKDDKK